MVGGTPVFRGISVGSHCRKIWVKSLVELLGGNIVSEVLKDTRFLVQHSEIRAI